MSAQNWLIRSARASDITFIYSTWLKSFRGDSTLGHSTKKSIFFTEYYRVLDEIFQKAETNTLVACLPSNEIVIVGYLVFEPEVLHYAFTKSDFKRFGIFRSLCQKAFDTSQVRIRGLGGPSIVYTHKTRSFEPVLASYPGLVYNPFLLFRRTTETK